MSKPTIKTATVRKDLQQEGLGVPVGDKYYHGSEPLPYRWVGKDEDEFQVKYKGKWVSAESIDFEFEQPCWHPTHARVRTHRGSHCGDCGKRF
ncbi:MAG: hypothetical protein AABY15_06880 [Nanoarchaeota archaeon]